MNRVETHSTDYVWGGFLSDGAWVIDEKEALDFSNENHLRRASNNQKTSELLSGHGFLPIGRFIYSLFKIFSAICFWYCFDRWRSKQRSRNGISKRLRKCFVTLGSSYIKFGQIISSGEGLFPVELVDEFKLLRDQVPPVEFFQIKQVIEEDFSRPLESIFSYFEIEPIAAASIAQVHRAILVTGESVVVKIQRPGVKDLVIKDIRTLVWLAPRLVGRIPITALANPPALVEVFSETIMEELDFRLEADNMLCIARVLAQTNQRSIVVPRPKLDLITKRVIVMEEIKGFTIEEIEQMKKEGIDTAGVLHAGLVAFCEGVMVYGVFHGDLHAGNLFIMKDGTTALLDFGITGRLDEAHRRAFLRMIIASMSGNTFAQIEALRDLGAFPQDIDITEVLKELNLDGPVRDPTKMSSEQLTNEMNDLTKKLLGYGASVPKELMLFAKNLMFLDGATSSLAPNIDILLEIQNVYTQIIQTHGVKIMSDLGVTTQDVDIDMNAVRSHLGVSEPISSLTYQDLLKRREIIKKRMKKDKE